MRALILNQQLRLDTQVPLPEPRGDQALLRILKAGVCRTDLELIGGYMNFSGILGHEFVARVERGPEDLLGQRVVGEINVACGECAMCRRGVPSQCFERATVGIDRHDGAFADYLALTTRNLYRVPSGISDEAAVFVEPLAAALQTLEAIQLQPRDRVIVLGAGKLGLLVAQVARLTGAEVAAVVRHAHQARLLDRWRIPALALDEVTARSAQVVIDCTGTAEGFADSLSLVEPRGTIVLKSTYRGMPQIDMTRIAVDEIKVVGSRCGPFAAALRVLDAGLVDVESLIDARYSLDEGLAAFEHAARRGALKVLVEISD